MCNLYMSNYIHTKRYSNICNYICIGNYIYIYIYIYILFKKLVKNKKNMDITHRPLPNNSNIIWPTQTRHPLRPIISSVCHATHKIAHAIAKILTPLLGTISPSHVNKSLFLIWLICQRRGLLCVGELWDRSMDNRNNGSEFLLLFYECGELFSSV